MQYITSRDPSIPKSEYCVIFYKKKAENTERIILEQGNFFHYRRRKISI